MSTIKQKHIIPRSRSRVIKDAMSVLARYIGFNVSDEKEYEFGEVSGEDGVGGENSHRAEGQEGFSTSGKPTSKPHRRTLSNTIFYLLSCAAILGVNQLGELPLRYNTRERTRMVKTLVPASSLSDREKVKGERRRKVTNKKRSKTEKAEKKIRKKAVEEEMVEITYPITESIVTRDNIIMIWGEPQLGKTSYMMRQSAMDIINMNRSSIIVLRPLKCDENQIKTRIDDFSQWLSDELSVEGFEVQRIEELGDDFDVEELMDVLTGDTPRIKVTLGNPTQLKRIGKVVKLAAERGRKTNYNVFFDECDYVGSDMTQTGIDAEIIEYYAEKNFKVSATIITNLLKDFVAQDRLFKIEMNPLYRGINTYSTPRNRMVIKEIPTVKGQPVDQTRRIPFIRTFLMKLRRKAPYSIGAYKAGARVPRMALINVTKNNAEQRIIFDWGLKKTGDGIAYILFNGLGTFIAHDDMPRTPVTAKGVTSTVEMKRSTNGRTSNVHCFKNLGIADAIQYLKDNGGVEKYPRIVIIAGHLASRGMFFGSADWGKFLRESNSGVKPTMVGWRTQTMIYNPSGSATQPSMIQDAARISGLVPKWDTIPATLYATNEVLCDVIRSVKLQEDLIIQALKGANRDEKYFHEILSELYYLNDKMAKGHAMTTKKTEHSPKKTNDPLKDHGMSLDDYDYDRKIVKAKDHGTYGEKSAVAETKVTEKVQTDMSRIVKAYANSGTYIHKIIQMFINCSFGALTAEQLRTTLGPKLTLANYDRWDLSRGRYKVLNKVDNKYVIDPSVVKALSLFD